VIIRVASGVVANNVRVYPQMSVGSTLLPYEPYIGHTYGLELPETLYGVQGAEDEVGSDGEAIKHTRYLALTGEQNWNATALQPTDTTLVIFALNTTSIALYPQGVCSHLPWHLSVGAGTVQEVAGGHSSTQRISFCIKKSRLPGWDDALSGTEKVALLATWLSANNVQVLYERATPEATTAQSVMIPALSGVNNVWSDGGGDTTVGGKVSPKWASDQVNARLAALEALATAT